MPWFVHLWRSWFEFIPRDRFDGGIGESSSVHRWLFHIFIVHGVVRRISREASFCMIIPGPIRGRDVTLWRSVNCFVVYRGWSWIVSAIQTRKPFRRRSTAWLSTVPEERGFPSDQVWTRLRGGGAGLTVPMWLGESSGLGGVPLW